MEQLKDEDLEQVAGGLFYFYPNTMRLTFTDEEAGFEKVYKILDYAEAWRISNELHGENVKESEIIEVMIDQGCIQ